MNPKSFGNLLALTTSIGLASSTTTFAKPVSNEPAPQDQIDLFCMNGILSNQIDSSVCNAETIAKLIAQMHANISNSVTTDEIEQSDQQKQKQFEEGIEF